MGGSMQAPCHALTHALVAKWLAWQKDLCQASAMASATSASGRCPKTPCAVSHTLMMMNHSVWESWGAWHGVPHACAHHVLVCCTSSWHHACTTTQVNPYLSKSSHPWFDRLLTMSSVMCQHAGVGGSWRRRLIIISVHQQ